MYDERAAVERCFAACLSPGELDRHWGELERLHRDGLGRDIRVTAFQYFLDRGLFHDPVVVEEVAIREAEALAFRDSLTGLYNYRYFEEQMRTELARAERYDTPLCLILLDLDGFKSVNDRRGHSVGNAVLKDVARVLAGGLREGDVLARLGGDEFAILLHQSDERAGLLIAERKRREIEEWFAGRAYDGAGVRVTASFGVSMLATPWSPRRGLFDDADLALYQAKESGRNRVFLSFVEWEPWVAERAATTVSQ